MEPNDSIEYRSYTNVCVTSSHDPIPTELFTSDKNIFSEESPKFCSENYVWIIVVLISIITAISISVYFFEKLKYS